jgi:hypothetical protein
MPQATSATPPHAIRTNPYSAIREFPNGGGRAFRPMWGHAQRRESVHERHAEVSVLRDSHVFGRTGGEQTRVRRAAVRRASESAGRAHPGVALRNVQERLSAPQRGPSHEPLVASAQYERTAPGATSTTMMALRSLNIAASSLGRQSGEPTPLPPSDGDLASPLALYAAHVPILCVFDLSDGGVNAESLPLPRLTRGHARCYSQRMTDHRTPDSRPDASGSGPADTSPRPHTVDETGFSAGVDQPSGDVPPEADIEQTDDPSKD